MNQPKRGTIVCKNSSESKISDALCILDQKFTDVNYWWRKLHNIVNRCYSHACPRFNDYGGRGIRVFDGWYDTKTHRYNATAFKDWCLSHGWTPGLQIDRIDNDGDYVPSNCRFVTAHENTRNRRNTRLITICGVTHCLKDWCKIAGMSYVCALNRCQNGAIPLVALLIDKKIRFRVGTYFYAKGHR